MVNSNVINVKNHKIEMYKFKKNFGVGRTCTFRAANYCFKPKTRDVMTVSQVSAMITKAEHFLLHFSSNF